ncbi:dephospho-CoA kinase, partial [bacterium]|nr:dephospho-CoA kinase [bacterium]
MPVIAITGGIGSGKSTVRRMFEELGAFGIDAD